MSLRVVDVGVMGYREAWALQEAVHGRVLGGELAGGALMLVEHPAVITVGRRAEARRHLLVGEEVLARRGVEVAETDRGGDITFHGPGQLVVYPILNLNYYGLNLHGYMRLLERVVMRVLGEFGISALRVEGCTGVWVREGEGENAECGMWNAELSGAVCSNAGLSKICAMGVKLRRWTTLHGLALNVTTDMGFFEMINPCGLSRPVTSMEKMLGAKSPGMGEVKGAMVGAFRELLAVPTGELGSPG